MHHTILGLIFAISLAHADADIVPPDHLTPAEKQEFVDTFSAERARLAQTQPTQEPVKPAESYAEMTGQKVDEPQAEASKEVSSQPKQPAVGKMRIFKDAEGNVLLTNHVGENNKPANNDFSEYNQELELKPMYKKVRVPTKKVYRKGWCKIGEDFAPCYKYKETIPAKTATVVSDYKEVPVKK